MSRKLLDIDDCWDAKSIDERIARLENLRSYGNDFAEEASKLIDELQERKRNLHKPG